MIEVKNRISKMTSLKEYCHLADKDDYVEVCEWASGDGFDVVQSVNKVEHSFSMTYGAWDAIQMLVHYKGNI